MKIFLLHYSAPPVVGGVESVIGHQARLMAEAGHEVHMVAGRGERTDERVGFVQIHMVDSRHPDVLTAKEQLDVGSIPKDFNELVEKLTKELRIVLSNADVLIAHNVCSLNKNLILTAALKKLSEDSQHPHFILWHHDLAWTTPRYRDELHPGYPWDLLCTAWDGAEQVTVSDFRRNELAELFQVTKDEIWVIPNGIDIARFMKLEEWTSKLIDRLDLLNAAPILLMPVRITPRKNIELGLRGVSEMRKQAPHTKLIVTGPLGPHNPANAQYFDRLRSLRSTLGLDDAVYFLAEFTDEFLPDEVIADFYRLADALFLPSREEGFGIPLLEAGLAGIPVFCTDIPPLRDLGASLVHYFSMDADPAGLASMILENLLPNELFEFRVRVRSQFAWQQIYRQQIQLLLERVSDK